MLTFFRMYIYNWMAKSTESVNTCAGTRGRSVILSCVVVLFLLFGAQFGWSADWPQWRGIHRDGVSAEPGLLTEWPEEGLESLWSASVGVGASSVAVADGRVFTMGNRDNKDVVTAFDAAKGRVLWKHEYPCAFSKRMFEGGTASTPTVDRGYVFTLSYEGDLYCLKSATGEVVWSSNLVEDLGGRPPKWGYAGSPMVIGEKLIVESGARGGAVVAFDKRSGELIWKSGNYRAGYSSPVLFKAGSDEALAVFHAYGMVGYVLSEGRELWSYRWKTDWDINAATPIVDGNYIFLSSGYGTGGAVIDIGSGSPAEIWKSDAMANQFGSSVLYKGNLYGFHGDAGRGKGSFRSVAFFTGAVNWKESGLRIGGVILVGDTLVLLTGGGELVLVQADHRAYREIARMQVLGGRSWAPPAYSDGRVFCRNNGGRLVVYRLGPSSGESALLTSGTDSGQ